MSIIKLILEETTTVEEAVQLLDKSGIGFLPVISRENVLLGIITDGDVRRAFLSGSMDLEHMINRQPKKFSNQTPRIEIMRKLKQMHLRHMPLVDDAGKLTDVVCLENLLVEPRVNKVIIMVGGLGTRLGDLTKEIPKPLLPIGGKPILERIIEDLKIQGFTDFTLCLNYKAEMIETYFKDGSTLGVTIAYTYEQKRMGTAGALSLIDKKNIHHPVLVLNGDILTNVDINDLLHFHSQSASQATMCVKPQDYEIPFACVRFDENSNLLELTEKPRVHNYINSGIYVLNPEVLDHVPFQEFYDMPNLFQSLVSKKLNVKVYCFEEFWMDIGMPNDLLKANDIDNYL